MKKSYTAFLFALSLTFSMTAQNKKTKKADQLYERLEYADAATAYEKLVKKGHADNYVYAQLGNSYYYMNASKEAEKNYRKAVASKSADAQTIYRYAQVLKRNGKVQEFQQWMENYARMNPTDSRSKAFLNNPNYLQELLNSEPEYTADVLSGVNSGYSDFGGFVYEDAFYFASSRNTKRKSYGWNDQPYLDIYKAQIVGESIQDPQLLKGDVNTKYHESSVSISPDGKRMYFDRNDYYRGKYKKGSDGVNQIHIYYAENVNGEWKDVQKAPFNDRNYSTGHPSVSPDGKWLYFSSDREGSVGDSDIYRVAINSDGSFGEPERLSSTINTEGKEVFPFIAKDGTLYFSSDGHPGMGGLDVFYAKAQGDSFGSVHNMGPAVNSSADDFAFHYDTERNKGFVSSDRSGNSSDNIYGVELIEVCESVIAVYIKDSKTREVLSNANVRLFDSNHNHLETKSSDSNGQVKFDADCDTDYFVEASHDDYEDNAITFAIQQEAVVEDDLLLDRIIVEDRIVINPIHFDFDKSDIKPEAALELDHVVAVMKKHENMIIKVEAHTDSQGSSEYNKGLSERRAQSTVAYIVSQGIDAGRISGEGFGDTKPEIDCGGNCSEEDHEINRRSEFIILER